MLSLSWISVFELSYILTKFTLAEVVDSTPTQSIFITLVKYSIVSNSF
jgi:hypothetical protein